MNNVDLTVALPLYNSSKIFWLCLEGLCNQKTNYNWELIICEDPSETFCGENYIKPYADRLKVAGCINYRYISLKEWIPLGQKWQVIAEQAQGENFMLTAADNYSPNNRIQLSCEALINDIQWFDCRESLFYNVLSRDEGHIVINSINTGVWMCTKTRLVKSLKGKGPRSGIDNWMQKQFQLTRNQKATVNDYLLGFHTDGMNNISLGRRNLYKDKNYFKSAQARGGANTPQGGWPSSFMEPKYRIEDVLSKPLLDKIYSLSESSHE